jgi:predicted  nucleic acid-binding Zn-ribbon protein
MSQTFEKLSGSSDFKESYDTFSSEISHLETQMKEISEKLKEYRHEKIKMKGLSDFQNQIDTCIKEQKEIESYIVGLSILQASTHCSEIVSE